MNNATTTATTMSPLWILLVEYAIGETQYTHLLLADVFDVEGAVLEPTSYDDVMTPMSLLTKQLMNGKSNANYVALIEAIQQKDADLYVRGEDEIGIILGRTQEEMESP
jgi:hypothetical protein